MREGPDRLPRGAVGGELQEEVMRSLEDTLGQAGQKGCAGRLGLQTVPGAGGWGRLASRSL